MNTLTAATKTVTVLHTEQEIIRCTARVDMPEYGVKAGEVFYLARSSEGNTFYVVVWSEDQSKWVCGHPSSKKAKPCTHVRAVSSYCRDRANPRLAPTPSPIKSIADRGNLNGNRPFNILKAS